jgi:hypothetical protein
LSALIAYDATGALPRQRNVIERVPTTGALELGSITRLIRERPPPNLHRLADSTTAVTPIEWLPAALAAADQVAIAAARIARSFDRGLRGAQYLHCRAMPP